MPPGTHRIGMLLMLGAAACVGIQAWFVKLASADVDPVTLAFLRFAASFLLMQGAMTAGWVNVRPVNRRLLWTRGVLGGIGSLCYFVAIAQTRLSNAIVLFYTYPFFSALIGLALKGGSGSSAVVAAFMASLIGIALIVQPSFETVLVGDLFALFSALAAGGAIVSLKASRRTDSAWAIFHYYNIGGLLVTAPFLVRNWTTPPLDAWPVLAGVLFFSIVSQLGMTYAYRYTTAAEGGVLSMFGAVVGSGLGIGLLGDPLTMGFVAGASIVLLSGVYLTVRGSEEGVSS